MKALYKQLFLKGLSAGIGLLFLAYSPALGQVRHERYNFNRRMINWGVKAGLNANAMVHLRVLQEEEELPNVSFRNRSGSDIGVFFRLNLNKFFVQPELEWMVLHQDISFLEVSRVELSVKTQSVNANGLIGYNITKTGPFTFNVIAGTSWRYQVEARYSMLHSESKYWNTNLTYSPYAVAGFSMNISNVHFDVRYALCLLTANIKFDDTSNKPNWAEGISIYDRENILSFSCGIMF